jgi:hypothetical protein
VDTSDDATHVSDALLLSSIMTLELWYGVGKSERNARNAPRLETSLAGPWSGSRSTSRTAGKPG